ncbi:hypothetical protein EDF24_2871 [Curtobacterium sp. PhB130]|uniref:hypothetical protein n=1 Tax=unclassified Curtobacterium TaxID=257496 RepID=UPI000F4C472E|nr:MULTISPECIES: hypothetical protein [unclassified Curtobacterium]ROP66083.1 hypothetical protein EDF55_0533 [Curtobacterium sp. ZW137]ROS73868.1 hypothetical protein EDF24_2871 [Curtobacterium sp. PhB130]
MTESVSKRDRWRGSRELVTVIILSVTAVLTAWCGFQASKWSGEMSIAFSQASSARVQAADASSEARDARQWDLTIWVQWVLADADGDTTLRNYVEERFTPELRTAFDAWQADGRADTGPFAEKSYVPEGSAHAAALSHRADQRFDVALQMNQRADNYSILTVLFALVLFLTAMSQRELNDRLRDVLLLTAIAGTVVGAVLLITFPVDL